MQATRQQVEFIPFLRTGKAYSMALGATNTQLQISSDQDVRGVTLTPVGDDAYVEISHDVAVVATTNSHFLIKGVPRDFRIGPGWYIDAIQNAGGGSLKVSEIL